MDYKKTLSYLFSQLPMYQRIGKAAYKADLDNTHKLDKITGHPHRKFKSIHIAGTNGKGSVSHMIAAVLQTAGYKTGLYTSPHLKDFRERIRINGEKIPEIKVIDFVNNYKNDFEKIKPSFFEMTVSMAFSYFADEEVDIAVIETGMGGRLDSTNIIRPEISIITNIGFDHTQFLGNTYGKIAFEKAGIIKFKTPVIIGEYNKTTKTVFLNTAKDKECNILFASDNLHCKTSTKHTSTHQTLNIFSKKSINPIEIKCDLLGLCQKKNIITALQAMDVLKQSGLNISPKNIYTGLANIKTLTGIKGRWEIIDFEPLIICDIAHNKEGLKIVIDQIMQTEYKNLHMVIGMVNDKDINQILKLLPVNAKYYFTKASIPRSLDEKKLKEQSSSYQLKGDYFPDVITAYNSARNNAEENDLIFIGGSTFVVSDFLCAY
ncbi:bifunctional folylpolyglutamate synthase/dihydrofolate synthase [Bacteroidota bacterium]